MSTHSDKIVSQSVKIETVSDRTPDVFYVERKMQILRTFKSKLGKTWTRSLSNDKYIVIDKRNGTQSEEYQNFTVAVAVMRDVAAGKHTGPMFPLSVEV